MRGHWEEAVRLSCWLELAARCGFSPVTQSAVKSLFDSFDLMIGIEAMERRDEREEEIWER